MSRLIAQVVIDCYVVGFDDGQQFGTVIRIENLHGESLEDFAKRAKAELNAFGKRVWRDDAEFVGDLVGGASS